MFKKILIANRGEIACRVAATAHRMGIKTVAVYSKADAHAKHVSACDEAVYVGDDQSDSCGNAAKDSYLRWQSIIQAAIDTGAQAIHPGYGFLSENEDFAHACAAAGLVFIGPPASAIRAMGLKAESKRLMATAGVPLVPGYHGADQSPALLASEAAKIGFPVLIKASAGGGGKGMRVVNSAAEFHAALTSCQREAQNSFGNDAVLIEKYVQRPRHIEIQVFGDSQGNCIYLFERDCSVQRRHQKVLEEAPAPGMTTALRKAMGEAAVNAALAVNYVGAGTVEFIVEQMAYDQPEHMKFYFMEMNTRLQVEHPVTEAITGLDLVEWQLRVAAGEALPLQQAQVQASGHAIEARICAENPDKQFLPATGTLQVYSKPEHWAFQSPQGLALGHVRIDDAVRMGDAISPFYDSMIGKLIVHAPTREAALAKLDVALSQLHIVGLATNVQFLRHVVQSHSFAAAKLDTALIEREQSVLFDQQRLSAASAAVLATRHLLKENNAQSTPTQPTDWIDPFATPSGWRMGEAHTREFKFELNGLPLVHQHIYTDSPASVELGKGCAVYAAQRSSTANAGGQADSSIALHIFTPEGYAQLNYTPSPARTQSGQADTHLGGLNAPMPGKLLSFAVTVGDAVKKGQVLAVMEAMKMEHSIAAPRDGTVAELLYQVGDQVADGSALLRLETAA